MEYEILYLWHQCQLLPHPKFWETTKALSHTPLTCTPEESLQENLCAWILIWLMT